MKIRNLNIRKSLISLLLAGTIALTASGCKNSNTANLPNKYASGEIVNTYLDDDLSSEVLDSIPNTQIQNVFEFSDDWDIIVYKKSVGFVYHDHIDEFVHNPKVHVSEISGTATTTARLNFRVGPSTKYTSMRVLPKNANAEVLGVTDTNWYLIKIDNELGWVYGDYIIFTPTLSETNDENATYLYTTCSVNFRVGPSTSNDKITTLSKRTPVEFVSSLDNNWYQVKFNGQTGYIYGKYLAKNRDLTDKVPFNNTTPSQTPAQNPDPNKTYTPFGTYRDDILKVVYATDSISLTENPNSADKSIYNIDKFEACEVIGIEGDWYKVRVGDQTGYIPNTNTQALSDIFIVVDISAQKLTMYFNNIILLEVDVTTGKENKHDTPHGLYSIYKKDTDTYLTGADYRCHVDYWMPFYRGYGLHDADWRSVFGGEYYKKSGSHGCVNIPPDQTDEIYETVYVGTKVLVHK